MNISLQLLNPATAALVAKVSQEKQQWLPLWVHSADTCGVMEWLCEKWLSEGALRASAGRIGRETLIRTACMLAALHDLGKASMLFQSRITADCSALKGRLEINGLALPDKSDRDFLQADKLPHGAAGELMLLQRACPFDFASIVGAHHGKPWAEGEQYEGEGIGDIALDPITLCLWGNKNRMPAWQRLQDDCFDALMSITGATLRDVPQHMEETTAVLLCALVIMADWIASNEHYFPLIPFGTLAPEDMDARLAEGLAKLDLPPCWQPAGEEDIDALCQKEFGFRPNEVQRTVSEAIQSAAEPGLMILEAPMGIGKTEAALLAAEMLSRRGAGGIFFGLPTQATANAIFDRVKDWGENQSVASRLSIRLAHGMADLNETFHALMAESDVSSIEPDGDKSGRLIVHEWFSGRKQSLLADFVIGTVDQLLMAALRQKHVMLRHLGLCGKVVIIDECHAYDAYMNQYLTETLRWLGAYKTPVIMLSATLPVRSRDAFLKAYLGVKKLTETPPDPYAYPLLSWTDGLESHFQPLKTGTLARKVEIVRLDGDGENAGGLSGLLQSELKDGGCAAVIVNTVRRSQQIACRLKEELTGFNVLLLHSQFTAADRLNHERKLLETLGKHSDEARRNKTIIVGTQVCEQSLDFDADVMFTDLCPADLLVQRIGRLHRHRVHDPIRPENLKTARCYVLHAGNELEGGAKYVYGEYLLMRTRAWLPETLLLPDGIAHFVQKVYNEDVAVAPVAEGYGAAKEDFKRKIEDLKQQANPFKLHDPGGLQGFSTLLEGAVPADEDHARAQVRAGDLTPDALLLRRGADGRLQPVSPRSHNLYWREDVTPDAGSARQLLAERVSLPKRIVGRVQWQQLMEEIALPKAWSESPWLRHAHLLRFDENGFAGIGDFLLSYSEEYGLKQEGEEKS